MNHHDHRPDEPADGPIDPETLAAFERQFATARAIRARDADDDQVAWLREWDRRRRLAAHQRSTRRQARTASMLIVGCLCAAIVAATFVRW